MFNGVFSKVRQNLAEKKIVDELKMLYFAKDFLTFLETFEIA